MSTVAIVLIFVPIWILAFIVSGLVIYGIHEEFGAKSAIISGIIIICVALVICGLIIESERQTAPVQQGTTTCEYINSGV